MMCIYYAVVSLSADICHYGTPDIAIFMGSCVVTLHVIHTVYTMHEDIPVPRPDVQARRVQSGEPGEPGEP